MKNQPSSRLKMHPSRRVHPSSMQGSTSREQAPPEPSPSTARLQSRPDLLPSESPRPLAGRTEEDVSGYCKSIARRLRFSAMLQSWQFSNIEFQVKAVQ